MNNNLENENASGENHGGDDANKPLRVLTVSSIIGDKVTNSAGEDIGEIKDIMIDLEYGKIEYVVIEFGGFLGFGEKLFAIPFSALKIDGKNRKILLEVNKTFLEKAPGFDKDHWPDTNSHFNAIFIHWGSFMAPTIV